MAEMMAALIARIRFASSSYNIRVETDDGVGVPVAETLSIPVNTATDYYLSGQGTADDLIALLQTRLNTNTAGGVYTVTISDAGRVTISCTRAFRILWGSGLTTIDATYFGFVGTQPDPKATSSTGTRTARTWWAPGQAVYRTNWGVPEVVGASERTLSGKTLTAVLSTDVDMWMVAWNALELALVHSKFAASDPYNAFDYWWKTFFIIGMPFRLYENISDRATFIRLKKIDFEVPYQIEEEVYLTTFEVRIVAREVL